MGLFYILFSKKNQQNQKLHNFKYVLLDFCSVQDTGMSCWKKIGRMFYSLTTVLHTQWFENRMLYGI